MIGPCGFIAIVYFTAVDYGEGCRNCAYVATDDRVPDDDDDINGRGDMNH